MRKKIVILCSDDWHHEYLTQILNNNFQVEKVIKEPAKHQRIRLLKKHRFRDYYYSIYHLYRRKILGLDQYRKNYFKYSTNRNNNLEEKIITVNNINEQSVIDSINNIAPDITIVIGTSILKKKILKACGEIILNIHGGYLPDYRGNHCCFFALFNREYDKVGSTIHFVDRYIDQGDIVAVVKPQIYESDNAEKLYCRVEMMAFQKLCNLINEYEHEEPLPRKPQTRIGHLYRTRDRKIRHDIILWLRQRRRNQEVLEKKHLRLGIF